MQVAATPTLSRATNPPSSSQARKGREPIPHLRFPFPPFLLGGGCAHCTILLLWVVCCGGRVTPFPLLQHGKQQRRGGGESKSESSTPGQQQLATCTSVFPPHTYCIFGFFFALSTGADGKVQPTRDFLKRHENVLKSRSLTFHVSAADFFILLHLRPRVP